MYVIILNVVPCPLPSCFRSSWGRGRGDKLRRVQFNCVKLETSITYLNVAEHTFLCSTQWSQKIQNVEVWSRETLIAGESKEKGWFVLKNLKFPNRFLGKVFISKIWGEGYRVYAFLRLADGEVIGQCSRNLVLSQKSPCSTWVETLEEELWPCPKVALLFVDSSLISASSPLISNCMN